MIARLVQLGQHFDHVRLGRAVQAGFRRQVIAVELVEARHVQHAEQPGADRVGGLLFHERNGRRQRGIVPEAQLDAQAVVPQFGRDRPLRRQQAQMAVGKVVQRVAVRDQVMGRAALGQQQAQHLLIDLGLFQALFGVARRLLQDLVGVLEVGAVPGPQPVAQPVDLAEAEARRQRRGVQVIDDDAPAGVCRVLAVQIGADAGRDHLAQLFRGAGGLAVRRVAVLLDLGRQRAAARYPHAGIEPLGRQSQDGIGEAVPLDRRIAHREGRVQQLAVLDEQQGIDDHRRDGIEVVVDPLRIARGVEDGAVAVLQRQAGAGLLAEHGEAAILDEPGQFRRRTGLLLDPVAAAGQGLHGLRDLGIAKPLVVRALGRIFDEFAGAGFDLICQLLAVLGQKPGLQPGGLHFLMADPGGTRCCRNQNSTDQPTLPAEATHQAMPSGIRMPIRNDRWIGFPARLGWRG